MSKAMSISPPEDTSGWTDLSNDPIDDDAWRRSELRDIMPEMTGEVANKVQTANTREAIEKMHVSYTQLKLPTNNSV